MAAVRVVIATCVLFAPTAPTRADVFVLVDILDPSDGGPQPPAGMLVIDVLVQTDPDDEMLGAGIRAHAVGANQFAYALDPNSAEPLIANPGSENPFVTCVSRPLPRFGN